MINPLPNFEDIVSELHVAGLRPIVIRDCERQAPFDGVVADSRKLYPGLIYCAIKGGTYDGHSFLKTTADSLSLAIIEDAGTELSSTSFGVIQVNSARAAWAQLASYFAGHPARKLKMIGVTGTNGKTSTVWMIKSLFDAAQIPAATIGTLGFYIGGTHRESLHTTPDPDVLYPLLSELVTMGISHVTMEVSSHALTQGKVWPIEFSFAAFTSFSQDHLDFHGSMDDYLTAKMLLFTRHLSKNGFALIHSSVAQIQVVRKYLSAAGNGLPLKATYSLNNPPPAHPADFHVQSDSNYVSGYSRVSVVSQKDHTRATLLTPMVGNIFAENFSAALIIVAQVLQKSLPELETLLSNSSFMPVPGRLQLVTPVQLPWRPLVYIDYAHTPDALAKAIETLSSDPNSITTVFGCGGDRDQSKRRIMGRVASQLSKAVIVTSDNPRTENPEAIVDEVLAGARPSTACRKVVDRREAIEMALSGGGASKKVLIAGKGHENYQIFGHSKQHFSDEEEALRVLSKPRQWLVYGAGLSGFEASKHLVKFGDRVFLSDDKDILRPDDLSPAVTIVKPAAIAWDKLSTVVISPGIPLDHEIPVKARNLGKEVITEVDLGFDRYRGSILGVTGTNGKSTTVAMTEHILRSLRLPAAACGNIGVPPTALDLRLESSTHTAVIELSSYQLEGSLSWPSIAAAITSFSFDHLARHKTLRNYFDAKWRITSWIGFGGLLIVMDDVARYASEFGVKWPDCTIVVVGASRSGLSLPAHSSFLELSNGVCHLNGDTVDLNSFGITGAHNHQNALMAALLAARVTDVHPGSLLTHLSNYRPLSYRCEIVFQKGDRMIVNDSKSTNLESTLSALSMVKRPSILLMGGQGKGESYLELARKVSQLRLLVTFGASRDTIKKDAPGGLAVTSFEKMKDAVLHALQVARDNNCDLIFSPGCASFDEFINFEHRGAVFNELVREFDPQA